MGTWGDLLGEAILAGVKHVAKNIQENIQGNIQEEQLKSAKEIYITCSPPTYTTGNALRAAALEQLFIAIASFMDIELITENKDVFFKVFVEEEDIGGGKKIHLLLNFIFFNGNNLVIQGVRGMGAAGITIVGNNNYELAKKIINALEKLEFENICVVKELIAYHDADEINEACEELIENFEAYHNDNEGDEDEESEDGDEEIYITYSITAPLSTQEDYIKRQVAMEEIYIWCRTEIMGTVYENAYGGKDHKGVFSERAYDIEYVNTSGFVCKVMSDFIIFNGVSTVTHGEIKKNDFQITISGNDIISISKKIMKKLKDFDFDGVPYFKSIKLIDEPFVYIRKKEVIDATNTLISEFPERVAKEEKEIRESANEDFDEDEESGEYDDEDEIDEDDNIVELCQFFSVEYPDFEVAALKKSYRKMMTQYHPDKVASLADDFKKLAEQKTKEINEKYECLLAWIEQKEDD